MIDNNLRYLTLMLQTLHSTVFRVGRGSGDTPLLYNTEEYNDKCSLFRVGDNPLLYNTEGYNDKCILFRVGDNPLLYNTVEYNDRCSLFRVGRGSGDTPLLYNTEGYILIDVHCPGLEGSPEILLSYTIRRNIMIGVQGSECQDPGLPSFSDSLQILCPVDPMHVLEMGVDRVPVVLDHLRADVAFKRFGLGLTLIF